MTITIRNLEQSFAVAGKWLYREAVSVWPVFLFFFVAFLIQLLIIKLAVQRLSIPVAVLSKAVVGALLAAKAVLILNETPLARKLESYRRIVAVAVKTFLYGVCTLLLGCIERFLEALHRIGTYDGAFSEVIDQADLYRFLAWILGISLIFAIYFVWTEISERMGEGALWSLFFQPPQIASGSVDTPTNADIDKRKWD
jgi:hypothetical protein